MNEYQPLPQPDDILLVEDNQTDQELELRALNKCNPFLKITLVQDGQEALDYLRCEGAYSDRNPQNPRIVLLDLKLPKISGIEVLRHIRAFPKTRLIPVVILTSSNQEKDLVETYRLGVNSYIVKPLDFADFQKVVNELGIYWTRHNQTPNL